jgi:preprotein translocase SecF subunit
MIDLVSKRFLFLFVSLLIIIPGVVAIFLGGIKLGIDFTGGTRLTVVPASAEAYNTEEFKRVLGTIGYEDSLVKSGSISGENIVTNTITMDIPRVANLPDEERELERSRIARALIEEELVAGSQVTETRELAPETTPTAASIITSTAAVTQSATVTATASLTGTATITSTGAVTATGTTTDTAGTTGTTTPVARPTEVVTVWRLEPRSVIDDTSIGPTVGSELVGRAFAAIGIAAFAILVYLTLVFRKVPNAIRFGVCAIFALLHDVLVVVGIFAILGLLFGAEIDALFVTAMLTVIGFSVHDTIVVFDRVRENILKRRFERFEDIVNYSLVQTLARSINTSITVILTLFALYLFGGGSIHNFVLALLIGIISGTYSSIFNASMLLVIWEKREWGRFLGRGSGETPAPGTRAAAR